MRSSDYRYLAREKLAGNWGIAVLVSFLAALLGGISTGGSINIDTEDIKPMMDIDWIQPILSAFLTYASIASIVSFVIGGVVELGYCSFHLNLHDGRPVAVNDLFSHFSTNFGGGFCLRLLTGLYIALWSMLFIIPGIVKGYSYAMAPYIMAEHPEMGTNECITESRRMMDGHKFDLFCLDLSFLGWEILCIFTLGIGNLFLVPYQQAARAVFYRTLTGPVSYAVE